MEQQPESSQSASNVVPLRVAGELPLALEELVDQALRIVLGLVTISTETLTEAVAQTLGGSGPREAEPGGSEGTSANLPRLAGAVMGAVMGAAFWGARAATTLVRTSQIVLTPVTTSPPFREGMRRIGVELDALDARWREERPRGERAAEAFVRLLVPQVVDAALDQVDIERIVAERVDVDGIVARVDLQRVVDRIDVDAVAADLDVEAFLSRLDLTAIAREVMDELDLPEIIRESMGSMTSETVGGIRVQSMNADRAISRLVGRVLQRRPRDEELPEVPA